MAWLQRDLEEKISISSLKSHDNTTHTPLPAVARHVSVPYVFIPFAHSCDNQRKPLSLLHLSGNLAMKIYIGLAMRISLAASVSALPNLVARQASCESLSCPGDLWDGLGGFFNRLLDQTPQSAPQRLPPVPLRLQDGQVDPQPAEEDRQDPQTSPVLDKTPQQDPQNPQQIPNTPPSPQSEIDMFMEVSPWPGDMCQATTARNPENTRNAVRY